MPQMRLRMSGGGHCMLKEGLPTQVEDFGETRDADLGQQAIKKIVRPQAVLISGVGTAFPSRKYTQEQVAEALGITDPTVKKLLTAKHIETRHLYLPEPIQGQKVIPTETHEELNEKFDRGVFDIGVKAATRALADSPFHKSEIDFLVCVTSTGFRVPGVSSILARALGLKDSLYRLDVVGMGCNAGMTALRSAEALAKTKLVGLVVCCEINSAAYVRDESIRTGIVNSLFGDGAAAMVLSTAKQVKAAKNAAGDREAVQAEVLGFHSHTISDQSAAMRFDWSQEQKKWSFGLSKQIPFVVGDNLHVPVQHLLQKHGLRIGDIKHWTIHTGGAAVIDGAKRSLGLSEHDVRHTRSVLKDFGNISSGSFMVSYQRLLENDRIADGDLGILIAMGPGATLEACLVRFHT